MSGAYYNEIDTYAAQWLRNLIRRGLIAPGEVDERSIEDVMPADLAGFTQCHFFAGIGVWSHSLRQAGWSDDRPVWTGSCPCQPFSEAGKGGGFTDERHLWPAFFHLIKECRPVTVIGEQVEGSVKHGWLDLVQTDLEGTGYATGAVCAPAAGVGAPHIRSRLYWVAHANHKRLEGWPGVSERTDQLTPGADGLVSWMAHASAPRLQNGNVAGGNGEVVVATERRIRTSGQSISSDGMGNTNESGLGQGCETATTARQGCSTDTAGWTNGFWRDTDWLPFRDSKIRPVEPGTFPMAPRTPNHVGRCRAYGNAIVAPLAAEFIKAYMSLTL